MSDTPRLSVVVPARNEAQRILPTLSDMQAFIARQPYEIEVIVVENGSKDATYDVLKERQATFPQLRVVQKNDCKGKGDAVKAGMLLAQGEYRLFMDADNSTPLSEVQKCWPMVREGVDIVVGSRSLHDSVITVRQAWYREWIGKLGNFFVRAVLRLPFKDTQAGFKLFSRAATESIFSRQTIAGWGFDMEILSLAKLLGYSAKEMPIVWHDEQGSNVHPVRAAINTFRELWTIRWRLWTNYYQKEHDAKSADV